LPDYSSLTIGLFGKDSYKILFTTACALKSATFNIIELEKN
ncbi:2601_t:CDS:1, partial [Gigaspora rosea]